MSDMNKETLKENMPKVIYLQHKSDDTYGELTWCEDLIDRFETLFSEWYGIKYVKNDTAVDDFKLAIDAMRKDVIEQFNFSQKGEQDGKEGR